MQKTTYFLTKNCPIFIWRLHSIYISLHCQTMGVRRDKEHVQLICAV